MIIYGIDRRCRQMPRAQRRCEPFKALQRIEMPPRAECVTSRYNAWMSHLIRSELSAYCRPESCSFHMSACQRNYRHEKSAWPLRFNGFACANGSGTKAPSAIHPAARSGGEDERAARTKSNSFAKSNAGRAGTVVRFTKRHCYQ